MPVDRPTFSESWYRVVDLRPRLRSAVQIHRQHYRGQTWYVIQDPANNQFYRLNPAAYHFVGMLDGRRSVGQVWRACNDALGDEAPTQGEAIQLLGQLYVANLMHADLPPDAESMFRRFRQRKSREVRGYLMNLLFIRIPLLDPEIFLNRWVGVVGWVFSPIGAAIWVAMVAIGLYSLGGHFDELIAQGKAVRLLSASNLPWLYVAIAIIKGFHEFGHAFACKRFGRKDGSGGEVHVMGIMFLVFTPLPYVDASSASAFRSKWHKVTVGAAGMFVELFLAAVAAVVWSQVTPNSIIHTVAYNVMFIASVSSLLFNGNALLRFDGYYILSDILEIPNLWNRSREYVYYLVKKYAWGARRVRCPSQSRGEKAWLLGYAVASITYRAFIIVAILLFVAKAIPVLGATLATVAVIAWVFVPLGKFLHYLLANQELMRCRARAIASTVATLCAAAAGISMIRITDHVRAEGVVRPQRQSVIYARADGFLSYHLPSGSVVRLGPAGGAEPVLLRCTNHTFEAARKTIQADESLLEAQWRQAQIAADYSSARSLFEQLQAVRDKLAYVDEQIDRLTLRAPHAGEWLAPQLDHLQGAYVNRGNPVGVLVDLDEPLIEAVVTQDEASRLFSEARDRVELRLPGRPAAEPWGKPLTGTIVEKVPAGQWNLPSPVLGTLGGGKVPLNPEGRGEAAEPFFKVFIKPDPGDSKLRSGQKVIVRFDLAEKSLAARWYRSVQQLVQTKLGM